MAKRNRFFSIRFKIYIFVVLVTLSVSIGISVLTYFMSVNQIDKYYKEVVSDNARNYASMVDGDYLGELRHLLESEEFQKIRDKAEEEEKDELIIDYLKEKGHWDKFNAIRKELTNYQNNMEGMEYLYIVAHGSANSDYDMYMITDEGSELTETGYYEEREAELRGLDLENLPEPTISNGPWGWLCSDFKPVHDSKGECVCLIGCDFQMEDVMAERRNLLGILVLASVAFTVLASFLSLLLINKIVVNPLVEINKGLRRFNPDEHVDYREAGVLNIDLKSNDEISDIYLNIQSMQMEIIDYISGISILKEEKTETEQILEEKDSEIEKLSQESYRDSLTGVGNKAAYVKKTEELNLLIGEGNAEFAMVMIDINNLKMVNDKYGHKSGDQYIRGCCHMICEAFKRSPVYRIGGDEFIVVLQGADYEKRADICTDLIAAFEKTFSMTDRESWQRYSAAIGLAEYQQGDTSAEFAFRRADKEMYENKNRFKKEHGCYR